MTADRFEVARVELFFELLRRDAVSSGQLNVSDAKSSHLVQRLAHIFLELIAQTVKLETDGFSWDCFNAGGPSQRYATEYKECNFKLHSAAARYRGLVLSLIANLGLAPQALCFRPLCGLTKLVRFADLWSKY